MSNAVPVVQVNFTLAGPSRFFVEAVDYTGFRPENHRRNETN